MASFEEHFNNNTNHALVISSSASSNSLSSLSSNSNSTNNNNNTHNLNNNNPSALSLNLFNSSALLTADKNILGSAADDLKSLNLGVSSNNAGCGLDVANSIVDKLMSSLILEEQQQQQLQQQNNRQLSATSPADLSSLVSSRSSSLAAANVVGNMFSDVFDSKPSDLEGGSLEDDAGSNDGGLDKNCKICW